MVNTVAGRGAVSSPLEKVKAAIHQELLVLDICHESQSKRYWLKKVSRSVFSRLWKLDPYKTHALRRLRAQMKTKIIRQ